MVNRTMWTGWRTLTTTLTQKQTDVSWATRRHLEDWKSFQHVETGEDMWSAGSSTRVFALEKISCGRKNCMTSDLVTKQKSVFLNISPVNSDYGFYRHENSSECLPQPDFMNQTMDICLDGELEDLQTSGWLNTTCFLLLTNKRIHTLIY